jgi:uncharacterized RDD family membrane protein YckC/uncharacterized membrane protein
MVDGWSVASNIVQTVAFLAPTPLLWLFLYLFAWDDPARARAAGFGRLTFWLLVGGGLLGILGDVPLLPIGTYVLGINVAGGLIPLTLSVLFLARIDPKPLPQLLPFFGLLVLETTAAIFGAAFLAPLAADLWVTLAVSGVTAYALYRYSARPEPNARVYGAAFALVSGAIVATFLATASEPGYGIVSQFPYYLLAPAGVGIAAVAIVESFGQPPVSALPMAYATATIGVLIGADVLRQPPLYGAGVGAFYVIGGAGPLDLLYLSGLLALVVAWAFDRAAHTVRVPRPAPAPGSGLPESLLRGSVQVAAGGDSMGSAELAAAAAESALRQARLLTGTPPGPPDAPWAGLAVPSWVDMDHRNLRSLVASRERRPRDAARAWWTARWLVRVARDVSQRRFASSTSRLFAGILDFAVLAIPALLALVVIVRFAGVPPDQLASNAWFNAASVGYAAWGFVYFAGAETAFGTTLGKRWLGLAVTDRTLARPRPVAALVRNLPKLVPLFIVGLVGAAAVLYAFQPTAVSGSNSSVVLPYFEVLVSLTFVLVLGTGIPAAAGGVAVAWSPEHQRIGDILAGTWVIRAAPTVRAPPLGASGAVSAPPGSG